MAKPRRNIMLLVAAPLMAVGLLVIVRAVRPWQERLVASYWQERIDGLPDDRLQGAFAALVQRGDLGIRILASHVGSPREGVSRMAYEALRKAISGWREDALSRPRARLRLIAEVLASSACHCRPAARDRAAALARQILLWMPPSTGGEHDQLIAHCETAVRLASGDTGQLAATPAGRTQLCQPASSAADRPGGRTGSPITSTSGERQVARAGHLAAIPQALAEPPLPTPLPWADRATSSPDIAVAVDGPTTIEGAASPPAAELPSAPRILSGPPEARPLPRPADIGAKSDDADNRPRAVMDQASGTEQLGGDITRLPTIDVMRLLHDPAEDQVTSAASELRQRGLGGQQIDLARDLTDPDPAVRRQLVDRLPATAGLNPRPWLLWLCGDDDADVRLAALTFLATGTDPRLLDHVRRIADRDQDPRIEALGRRIRERGLR